jgi:type I restriction enzyme S subunit
MKFELTSLGVQSVFFNNLRKPVTRSARTTGRYPYYGAAGIQDLVSDYLFDGSYILVGEDGTVVTNGEYPVVQIAEGKFWVNNHAHVLRPLDSCDFDFLYYLLKGTKVTNLITGAVQPKLSMTNLKSLELIWPENPKVRLAIGQVLRLLDRKIQINKELSKTLEDIAQTIFKSWFIDFDPVKAKMAGEKPVGMDDATAALFPDSMEDSELGLIPSGWFAGNLADVFSLQGGYSFKSSSWAERGVPVVKIGSVKPGLVDLNQVSYISQELAANVSSSFKLESGSLVIGLTGYVGQVGLVRTHFPAPLLNQRVARFGGVDGEWRVPFTYCLTRRLEFKKAVENAAIGSAQQNVSIAQILGLPHAVPPFAARAQFDDLFENSFRKIIALADENEILGQLRDALLPRLISGELQIPEEMLAS